MRFPINHNNCPGVPINYHPGSFGFKRPWNHHPGVDLYTNDGEAIYAIEDGEVVSTGLFTGPQVGSDWWETTWYVMIEGRSGVFNYGEVYGPTLQVGQKVFSGDAIASVKRVLFEDKYRPHIPGHSTSMLHLELYERGSTEPVEWLDKKPATLLDPTPIILPLWLKEKPMVNFQFAGINL